MTAQNARAAAVVSRAAVRSIDTTPAAPRSSREGSVSEHRHPGRQPAPRRVDASAQPVEQAHEPGSEHASRSSEAAGNGTQHDLNRAPTTQRLPREARTSAMACPAARVTTAIREPSARAACHVALSVSAVARPAARTITAMRAPAARTNRQVARMASAAWCPSARPMTAIRIPTATVNRQVARRRAKIGQPRHAGSLRCGHRPGGGRRRRCERRAR